MKTLILLLTIVSYTQNLVAETTTLYFSPQVDQKEKTSFLDVEKNFMSFSDHYLAIVPAEKNVDQLLHEFELAQKYVLVRAFPSAKDHYLKVIAMQDIDDWKEIQRKIIFMSYVQMGTIETEHQMEWLKKAVAFSPDFSPNDYDLNNDQTDKLKELKNEIDSKSIVWSVQPLQKNFSYILMNGHTIDLKKYDTIKISAGTYRITYLSDSLKPQTYQVTSQQIPLIEPSQIPFVSGDCKNPQFNQEGETVENSAVYYNDHCVRYLNKNHWSDLPPKAGEIVDTTSMAQNDLTNQLAQISNTKIESEPIYKKTWFWVAIGTAVVGYVIYANQKKDSGPSHQTITKF